MSENSSKENENFKIIFFKYLSHWKYILVSLVLSLSFAVIYLKFTQQSFKTTSSLIVKDGSKNEISDQLSAFEGLGLNLGNASSSVENEIQLLKSRSLISKVVQVLKLNVNYHDLNTVNNKELFSEKPINITFLNGDSTAYQKTGLIEIKSIDKSSFEILDDNRKRTCRFGSTINSTFGDIIITPNENFLKPFYLKITLTKFNQTVDLLSQKLAVEKQNKENSIILLSIVTSNISEGKAFLQELINQHTKDAIIDKNEIAKNTLDFINERITYITRELTDVEQDVSSFKSSNKIFDLALNTSSFLESEKQNQKLLSENNIQLKLTEFISEHLKDAKSNELLPYNIGISNTAIDNLISNINNIILERNKLLIRSSSNNPIVSNLEEQILNLKSNLKESLTSQKNSLKIKNKELTREQNILQRKLTSAPSQEKDFREFARQQQIKETLYLFLLQKREETAISEAVTISNIKIIDPPYSDEKATSPKKSIVYIIALFLGLLIPIGIIYIINLFDTKIHNNSEISNLGIPYIGDIPITDSKNKLVVGLAERSSVAEAFRLLRTNVNFLIPSAKNSAKSIFITSTISNEGKSFIALNLAATIGLSGKKVALLGLDLRAPKILQYINEEKTIGITSFIVDSSISVKDISIKIPEIENLTIIPSGPIPPNPAELLMSDRLSDLFDEVKQQFDFIVVDTAPVGLVADSLLLNKYADMFIYVARANFLDKRLLNIAESLYEENKLKNMSILLNCSDYKRNYGYGYSYGYGDDSSYVAKREKTWFQKLLKK
jgi:capsular exopolysaccharide synthesis family protein